MVLLLELKVKSWGEGLLSMEIDYVLVWEYFYPNLKKKERNFSLFIIISPKATFLEMNVQ